MNTSAQLTAADRAELCRRVDFLAVLQADGVAVKRNGKAYLCALRDERTPSCHVYPPEVGQKGAAGWTLKDYGDAWGGDALAYLVDKRGLPFMDAVAELCRLACWTPESIKGSLAGCPRKPERPPTLTLTPAILPRRDGPPTMQESAQRDAVAVFLAALSDLHPAAIDYGTAYLAERGCRPAGLPPVAYHLPADLCAPLADRLAQSPAAPDLVQAGLLKPAQDGKPPRLAWWTPCLLLACMDTQARPVYLVARRLDWKDGDRLGKYLNQSCAGGAVRWPFNLPALYHAAGRLPAWPVKYPTARAGDVLLVEGTLDALGAAVLGWPAVALLNRPQAHHYKDKDGAAARMLDPHLPALRGVRRVLVVPDADQGSKGAEGEALAARLVGWLRFAGVRADLALLADLCPEFDNCKDLADVAKLKGCPP